LLVYLASLVLLASLAMLGTILETHARNSFAGMYKLTLGENKPFRLIVMNNLFDTK
jgi:hypothetical protein